MTEISILKGILFIALALAPIMTNKFFLNGSKTYAVAHKIALALLLLALFFGFEHAVVIWPVFCLGGFLFFLRHEYKKIFFAHHLAACIAFLFSLISATWIVAATYDLHLLGYPMNWSLYAAIHGTFIGWIFVGCLAFLANKTSNRTYAAASFASLFSFLCVAYGINGTPYIKRIGVIGLSILLPMMIAYYTAQLNKANRVSLMLASTSLLAIGISMTLALLNEFWPVIPRMAAGIPLMVLTHGLLNAILAVPCFFLAIQFESTSRFFLRPTNDSEKFSANR